MTGYNFDGFQRTSEMIDLAIKSDSSCKNWAEFPKDVEAATGGVIKETVVICGGVVDPGESFNECYSMNGKVATLITHMTAKRAYAASLVINGASLWITGGWSTDTGRLASSEYITLEGSIPGPDMPIYISSHALVAINKTCSLLIGGRTNGLEFASVYYFEHEGENWSQGPDLMQLRCSHAAGLVTDETTYDEFVIVTGGEYNGIILDSTEILVDNQWHLGKIANYSMVPLMTHGFLLRSPWITLPCQVS